MIWFAIAVGGTLGSGARHGGMLVVERLLPPFGESCRRLWAHRVDAFVAGLVVAGLEHIHFVTIGSGHPRAVLGLLAAFTAFATLPSSCAERQSVSGSMRQLMLGIVAATAGWLIGCQL